MPEPFTKPRAPGFTIGEASRVSGVHIETIRYYERCGLLSPVPRTAAGRRLFGESDLHRLSFIRHARGFGFAMKDIRELLRLGEPGAAECADVCALARPHLAKIRDQIRSLQKLEAELLAAMAICDETAGPVCGVTEVLNPKRAVRADI